ncbi:hypothetical protein ACTXT7_009723 [Hymenolepis weldensis]
MSSCRPNFKSARLPANFTLRASRISEYIYGDTDIRKILTIEARSSTRANKPPNPTFLHYRHSVHVNILPTARKQASITG